MGKIKILVLEIKHSLVIGQYRKKYYTIYRKFLLQLLGDIVGTGEWGRGDWQYKWDSYWEIVNEMQ